MSDPLGLLTGGALLGGALADAPPSPPTETPPAPGETRRAAGVSRLVPDEPTFPAPEAPEATVPTILPPPTSPAAGTAESALTTDLLDDLLAPPLTEPATAPAPPQPAPDSEFRRDPPIDTAPEQTGGGGGGGGGNAATAVSGGGGDDGARSRGGLIEDADAGSAEASGGTALMMMSGSGGGSASGGGSGSGTGSGSGSGSCSGSGAVLAGDDQYSVYTFDAPRVVSAPYGVLGNDASEGGCPLTAELVSGPSQGTVDLNSDGTFTYYPSLDGSGTDSFVYRASRGGGGSDTATVLLPYVNYAPEGQPESYAALAGTTLTVSAAEGLLANDTDMNVSTPEVLEVATYTQPKDDLGQTIGSLSVNAADGSFTYTPLVDWYGTVTFTYRVGDGIDVALQETTVTLGVFDLRIIDSYAGIDITGQTQETIVGMGISLYASLVGPGEPPFEWGNIDGTHQWTVSGDTVQDYDISLAAGVKDLLSPADLKNSWVHFYWIDGISSANVSVTATINATTVTASTTFNVAEPTLAASPHLQWTSPLFGELTTLSPKVREWSDGTIGLGDLTAIPQSDGIEIKGSVKAPPGGPGRIGFIQLVNSSESWGGSLADDGSFTTGWVLDEAHGLYYNGRALIPDGGYAAAPAIADSPGTEPSPLFTTWSRSDQFKVYLMYQPDGTDTIPVTVGILTWDWSVDASRGTTVSNWTINSWSANVGNGTASSELPEWTTNYGDATD